MSNEKTVDLDAMMEEVAETCADEICERDPMFSDEEFAVEFSRLPSVDVTPERSDIERIVKTIATKKREAIQLRADADAEIAALTEKYIDPIRNRVDAAAKSFENQAAWLEAHYYELLREYAIERSAEIGKKTIDTVYGKLKLRDSTYTGNVKEEAQAGLVALLKQSLGNDVYESAIVKPESVVWGKLKPRLVLAGNGMPLLKDTGESLADFLDIVPGEENKLTIEI